MLAAGSADPSWVDPFPQILSDAASAEFKGWPAEPWRGEALWRQFLAKEVQPVSTDTGIVYAAGSPMEKVLRAVQQVAQSPRPVLVRGESGTGKELVCAHIHRRSERSGPFHRLNCARLAGIDSKMVQADLFGIGPNHALPNLPLQGRPGLLQRLHRGTLHLDEVHRLPFATQALLLRFLEDHICEAATGELLPVETDVRLICATNVDLEQEIAQGRFLYELFARLVGLEVCLPPLRARPEDLPVLLDHFLQSAPSGPPVQVSKDLFLALLFHPWPGNVRELKALIESAVTCLRNDPDAEGGKPKLSLASLENLAVAWSLKRALHAADAERRKATACAALGSRGPAIIEELRQKLADFFSAIWLAWEFQTAEVRETAIQGVVRDFGRWLFGADFETKAGLNQNVNLFEMLMVWYGNGALVAQLLKAVYDALKQAHIQMSRSDENPRYRIFDRLFGMKYERLRKLRPQKSH